MAAVLRSSVLWSRFDRAANLVSTPFTSASVRARVGGGGGGAGRATAGFSLSPFRHALVVVETRIASAAVIRTTGRGRWPGELWADKEVSRG
ncbi:hypothetical protein GCM10010411_45530 [Actinomadura fulvescens]|uniref:Secreted protein n=1 Tax=Actinomadura fulvescens TaxID=46160 RepID=A0ABN3PXI7_9ACTN